MVGRLGLWKRVKSFFNRPPALGFNFPLPVKLQPPCHFSWSSQVRGYPTPGRVSTLLNQMYSVPSRLDRKSTRLNSSHVSISYAVFCLKKKKQNNTHLY